MIVLVRVDDRLVHGQVMEAWVPFFKANSIIVASDEAAKSSFQKQAIESCAHSDLIVKVAEARDAIHDICEGRYDTCRVIVLVSGLRDAMRLYEGGVPFTAINIGNLHHNGEARMITRSVYFNKEDEEIINRFRELGIEIEIQAVPHENAVSYTGE
ncbi:MAG: PTS sugar transporter subunit IIB [Thermodesulfobacteriota bacterium]